MDKFLTSVPSGPCDTSRTSFGTRCCCFALSSSGCTPLKLSVPSYLGSPNSSLVLLRVRSSSPRRVKMPLALLRSRESVGDGNVVRSPRAVVNRQPADRSDGFFDWGEAPFCQVQGVILILSFFLFRSVLGESFSDTPMVLPIRGCLDDIMRMMVGDFYTGRGCRQRGLGRIEFCNDFKVAVCGRDLPISSFAEKLSSDRVLRSHFWRLSGLRLVCHCRLSQACHGNVIIREFSHRYLGAFNREEMDGAVPSSMVLNCMSRLREEPESGDESSADEGVPHKGSGWRGLEEPMLVGVGWPLQGVGRWRKDVIPKMHCGLHWRPSPWITRTGTVLPSC